jgi:uncharacterized protein (TIGR03437 family)
VRRLRVALAFVSGASFAACSANNDIPTPQIASITPDHGAAGTVVQIAGSYFCQRPDTGNEDPTCATAGSVEFGTVPGIATAWADNAIQVEVPAVSTGAVAVTVTAAGRISNSATFSID